MTTRPTQMLCGECQSPLAHVPCVIDGETFDTWTPCQQHPNAGYWWKGERYLSPSEMPKYIRRG